MEWRDYYYFLNKKWVFFETWMGKKMGKRVMQVLSTNGTDQGNKILFKR